MTQDRSTPSERYVVAYHPGGGLMSRGQVIEKVRDELADLDDVPEEEFKVVRSLNIPNDDRLYVFDMKLITELST